MKLSLKRKKKDEVPADVDAVEEKPTPVAVKPVGGGAQEWLLLHAEKLVCAGVAVLLGLMIYSAWGKLVPKEQHTPENLKDKVNAVNRSVEQSQFPQDRYPVKAFADVARRGQASIPHDGYSFESVAGEDIGDDGGKRPKPTLYPPIDLEVKPGVGVFYVKQKDPTLAGLRLPRVAKNNKPLPAGIDPGVMPPTGSLREGRRWVSIVGKVPYARQRKRYDADYKGANAYDPERDQPKYRIALIQRLEIAPGTPAGQPDWSKAKTWGRAEVESKLLEISKWAITADELVAEDQMIAELCDPLGPLGKSWKPWATHSEIPFAPPKDDAPNPNRLHPRVGPPRPAADEPKEDAADDDPRAPVDDVFGPPPEKQEEPDEPAADELPAPEAEKPKDEEVTFKLVRVFDFTVEPGKQYRYRIQLYLYNPNFGVEPRFLVDPDSRDDQFVTSDWSESSETVRIPDDAQVLAAGVLPPPEEIPEPRVDVIANLLDIAAGVAPSVRLDLRRGEVVGGKETALEIDSMERVLVEHVNLPVMTEVTVLDFGGDDALAPSIKAPTEMLVLDGAGNLTIKNSADDASAIAEFNALEGAEAPAENAAPKDPANRVPKASDEGESDVEKILGR